MCGKAAPSHVSVRPDDAYSAVFCDEQCAVQYWHTHSATPHAQLVWTHAAKCLMLSRLFSQPNPAPKPIGDDIAAPAVSPAPVAATAAVPSADAEAGDANAFRKYFDALAILKTRLEGLHGALEEVKTSDSTTTEVHTWIVGFDALMRDLDVLYAQDFNDQFVKRVMDLQRIHEKCHDKPALTRSLGEIKNILSMLVRRMPLNRDLYNNRDVLKRLLGMNRYCTEKLILTLDGGGMKGIVTLTVLKALLNKIRRKLNDPSIRITDCFDLMIGTSTGGIIVGCLCAANLEIEQIERIYETLGTQVFSKKNQTSLRYRMICKYSDDIMWKIMRDLFGSKRLDDPALAFQEGGKMPRFGFIATDLSTSKAIPYLLRNYDEYMSTKVEPLAIGGTGQRIRGTNHCYVSEGVRATGSAPTAIHPYARFYAPFVGRSGRKYLQDDYSVLYANLHEDPEEVRAAFIKQRSDTLMESGVVLIDGGTRANNPGMIGLTEAQHLWGDLDNCGMRVISIGTGFLPISPNPSWGPGVPRPVTQGLFGEHSVLDVFGDLIKFSLVGPACETEETDAMMHRFGALLAAYERLNPPLGTFIEMDDASPRSIELLRQYAQTYCDSPAGVEVLDRITEAIALNSTRLHPAPPPAAAAV